MEYDEEGEETSDESNDKAVPPTAQRCERCDLLKIMQGILKRRLRRRGQTTELHNSTRLW